MKLNQTLPVFLAFFTLLSTSYMHAQSTTDSTITVEAPLGYAIPLDKLDSSALQLLDSEDNLGESEVVYGAMYNLSFDTTSAVDLETIMEDMDFVPIVSDDLLKDRLTCLENRVPLHFHNRVKAFINYFAVKDRTFTMRVLQRKNMYFPIYEKTLAKYGMPDELKYLSIIESALIPNAKSRARAVGLWQFMAATGRMYGLSQSYYIDERMDPVKSTEAACKYLRDLHNMFNDWELAIAAYNCGPGNIRKAIRRSGYKKTFWEIFDYLPRETRSYLPQLVAMIYIINYAEEHNLHQSAPFYETPTATIEISQFLDLGLLANELKICEEDLRLMNPELKRAAVPANVQNYPLRIPANRLAIFNADKDSILVRAKAKHTYQPYSYASRGSYKSSDKYYHVVRSGESLGLIAQRNGVSLSSLKSWNGLRGNTIYAGQKLAIYTKKRSSKSYSSSGSKSSATYHYVRRGEVLGSIATRYGIGLTDLKKWNNLSNDKIYAGQKLRVKPTTGKTASTTKKSNTTAPATTYSSGGKYHIVRSGENLSVIAGKYGVRIAELKTWNSLYSNSLKVGQKLVIKATGTIKTSKPTAKAVAKNGQYVVKEGDSLWLIANQFGLTVAQLKSLNGLRNSKLDIGQVLRVK